MSLHINDMMASIKMISDRFFDAVVTSLRWSVLVAPALLSFVQPAHAEAGYTVTETIEYEVSDEDVPRLVAPSHQSMADFGPFHVISSEKAELNGGIDSDAPGRFSAMLAAYPSLRQIDMIDCPGTEDDEANLLVARMIRGKGLVMHIPRGGSIRSGGVELFLAGAQRIADKGAEIGVHSWRDSDGLEATDFPESDAVHQPYLAFYRDMGMSADTARAFYDFTNTVASSDHLHIMTEQEVRRFGLVTG
jgi:hypothetical protein